MYYLISKLQVSSEISDFQPWMTPSALCTLRTNIPLTFWTSKHTPPLFYTY